MSYLDFWLSMILLIGAVTAADVPFVFDKTTSHVADYTSSQIEQARISSPDLADVPTVTQPADNETLEFPVIGGGSLSKGATEKNVNDLKTELDARVEPDNPHVRDEAVVIALSYPGEKSIEQIASIYSYLKNGDDSKNGWGYVSDPRGTDYFMFANQTLINGDRARPPCVGGGDCDDFAILMAALVESVGGTTRIILARNNSTGGHAYAEVYLGQLNATGSQVETIINWLKDEFDTDKIYTHIDTDAKDVWLNLDWGPDEEGNAHPGGPFYQGDRHIVLCIRDTLAKTPLKLPLKSNRPPKLISLSSDKSSPQYAGTAVKWTAQAKDPEDDDMLYRFFLNDEPETNWIKENNWTWSTTDYYIGDNQIEVRVRDGKHAGPNEFDGNKAIDFAVNEPETRPIETTTVTEPSTTAPTPSTVAASTTEVNAESWQKTLGGSEDDSANSVQLTNDGGYIIAGETPSYGGVGLDAWLINMDSEGNTIWERTFDGSPIDEAFSFQQMDDGGYIIVGYTYPQGDHGEGAGDAWLIKSDSEGNKIWDRILGGSKVDVANSIQHTSDGEYIIAGSTYSYGAGSRDAWLIKIDSEGNRIWDKTFERPGSVLARAVQQTSDGGCIIACCTLSDTYDQNRNIWLIENSWLIKTDSEGNKIWDKTFDDEVKSIQPTNDDGYILAGATKSYGAGGQDALLIKIDSEGNKIWDKTFGGSEFDSANAVQLTNDGGYIIAGLTESYGAGKSDALLIKTDTDGNKTWDKTFGGPQDDEVKSVQQTNDGGYILAGVTKSYGAGGQDAWIIKTDANGL